MHRSNQLSAWMVAMLLFGCASKSAAPPKDVTYQLVEASCARCDLDQLAAERVSRSAVDCGTATAVTDEARLLACITEALSAGRAFRATVDSSSPQSTVRSVFLGNAAGEKLELRFDSGLGSGKLACNASVTEKACSAILAGRDGRITCTGPASALQSLCDETGVVHKGSLKERPVSELSCTGELETHGGESVAWVACRRRTDGPPAVLPLPVVCSQLLRDPDAMICFERTGWENANSLGSVH